jgi:uncharacterized membrane protein
MSSKSSKPTQQITTIQRVEYKGILPPPEMLRQFQEFDPALPAKIVDLADRSVAMQEKEIDTYSERMRGDIANARAEIAVKELAVLEQSRQTFKTQMVIFCIIAIILAVTVLLALLGQSAVAIAIATGGFLTMISNTLHGSNKKAD